MIVTLNCSLWAIPRFLWMHRRVKPLLHLNWRVPIKEVYSYMPYDCTRPPTLFHEYLLMVLRFTSYYDYQCYYYIIWDLT